MGMTGRRGVRSDEPVSIGGRRSRARREGFDSASPSYAPSSFVTLHVHAPALRLDADNALPTHHGSAHLPRGMWVISDLTTVSRLSYFRGRTPRFGSRFSGFAESRLLALLDP
jgi:hypothetical protein